MSDNDSDNESTNSSSGSSSDTPLIIKGATNAAQKVMTAIASSASFIPRPPRHKRKTTFRDHAAAHDELVLNYFTNSPLFDIRKFRRRYRMNPPLFNKILQACEETDDFFQQRPDCSGRMGFSSLQKCTSVIRQSAMDHVPIHWTSI